MFLKRRSVVPDDRGGFGTQSVPFPLVAGFRPFICNKAFPPLHLHIAVLQCRNPLGRSVAGRQATEG